jgi:hypothetical protein
MQNSEEKNMRLTTKINRFFLLFFGGLMSVMIILNVYYQIFPADLDSLLERNKTGVTPQLLAFMAALPVMFIVGMFFFIFYVVVRGFISLIPRPAEELVDKLSEEMMNNARIIEEYRLPDSFKHVVALLVFGLMTIFYFELGFGSDLEAWNRFLFSDEVVLVLFALFLFGGFFWFGANVVYLGILQGTPGNEDLHSALRKKSPKSLTRFWKIYRMVFLGLVFLLIMNVFAG